MILDLVIKLLLYFCVLISAITFLPSRIGLLDIHPKSFEAALPKSLSQFKSLDAVPYSDIEQIGPIVGPESIGYYGGRLVTGSDDGYLYEIKPDGTLKRLVRLAEACTIAEKRSGAKAACARPLGMNFDSTGRLFVVEPSFGVYKVEDVFGLKPRVTLAFNITQTASLGEASRFLNDVAVQEKKKSGHVLYISDISTKFNLESGLIPLLGSERGRVLRYDTETSKLDIIAPNMFIPNGMELTEDGSALVFAEFAPRNIWRYQLSGPNSGTLTKILTNLPGEPDNIRRSLKGDTFLLSLTKPRTLLQPSEYDYYMKKPWLRKLLARVSHMSGQLFEPIGRLLENERLQELAYSLKTLQIAMPILLPEKGGMLLEIDVNGKILNSVYSDVELGRVSEVREVPSAEPADEKRTFYLGSFGLSYVRKLILKL